MADPRQMIIEIIYDDDKGTPVIKANELAVEKYGKQLKEFDTALQKTGKGQSNFKKTTQATNLALIDTGRVVQDLPYGIRGVANNIDPLIQSFQRLDIQAKKSNSTIGKELIKGLTGPAGIAVAISAVTSLMVAYGPQIKDFFLNYGEGAKEVERAKKELELLKTSVGGGISDFLKEIGDSNQIKAIEEALKQFDPEVNGAKDLKIDVDAITKALSNLDPNAMQFSIGEDGSLVSATRAEVEAGIKEQGEINNLVKEELERRLAILKADEKILETRKMLGLGRSEAQIKAESERLAEIARQSLPEILSPSFEGIDESLPDIKFLDNIGEDAFAGARSINSLTNSLQRYGYTLEEINGMSQETGEGLLRNAIAAEQFSNMLTSQVIGSIADTADMLGALMATKPESGEIFAGFQLMFANFLGTFGQQLVALGIGKIALDSLFLSKLGGPAAIAAGTALMIAAGAVRASAQSKLAGITGNSSTGNVLIGYRGAQSVQQDNSNSFSFPSSVSVRLTDGTGNIVANGLMELDRKGQSIYVGG